MRGTWFLLTLCCLLIVLELLPATHAGPYLDEDDGYEDDYIDNSLDRLFQNAQKRSSLIYLFRRACIKRFGNCDHRRNDCCYSSSCRCNLWGSNCRCQRMGLFQKWG